MPFIECINSAVAAFKEAGLTNHFVVHDEVCVCVSIFTICHPERYFSVFLMQIFTKLDFFCMPAAVTDYRRQ